MNDDDQLQRPRPSWRTIDHVQLAIPPGGEEQARHFFVDVLGFVEVPRPSALATRGGCWFDSGDISIHVGIEEDFRPARKAHPALLVDDLRGVADRCGLDIAWSEDIPGSVRGFVHDPFGNRIELIDAAHRGV